MLQYFCLSTFQIYERGHVQHEGRVFETAALDFAFQCSLYHFRGVSQKISRVSKINFFQFIRKKIIFRQKS